MECNGQPAKPYFSTSNRAYSWFSDAIVFFDQWLFHDDDVAAAGPGGTGASACAADSVALFAGSGDDPAIVALAGSSGGGTGCGCCWCRVSRMRAKGCGATC